MSRRRLLFVSPQFLFPLDAGGKIRTTNILRGLNGGAFKVTLISPAVPGAETKWHDEIARAADRFASWPDPTRGPVGRARRALGVLHPLPVTVAVDISGAASALVARELAEPYDAVVFDYVHAAVFMPQRCAASTLCLTHNVEAEIIERHAAVARGPMRLVWRDQHRKMLRFERAALARFDTVIAVSERDARMFRENYGLARVAAIPTGVDLDYFRFEAPGAGVAAEPLVAFTGSMDSRANVDGVEWFLEAIWPKVAAKRPQARCVVIGKNPPAGLVARARGQGLRVQFTGFVDDVRPHMRGADVSVIPLRVGGGTRIKAYEAMAMGLPIVSTALGVEGLPVEDGKHLLIADDDAGFAARVLELIDSPARRGAIAASARALVEGHFGTARVTQVFEQICLDACARRAAAKTATAP